MSTPQFSRPGAFDLSALAKPASPAGGPRGAGEAPPGASGPGAYSISVTEAEFQSAVIDPSMQYVVVLALWSPRSPASEQLNGVLGRVADEYDGRFLLATMDVDTNQQIAQAVGAQSVPFVLGIVRGQPVPLFQGTLGADDIKRYLDELLKVASANGVTGRAQLAAPAGPAVDDVPEPEDVPDDPRFAEGDAALAAGDLAGAVTAYQKLVDANPGNPEMAERLAGVSLMYRVQDADPATARSAAAERPDDVDAQALVADLDVSGGHVEDAFTRMIQTVARAGGEERERARQHLVSLFTVVGLDDPRVLTARRRLASALF